MKLKDAEILMRYPVPAGAGFSAYRSGSRIVVSFNIPGSGKLRLALDPDSLDICSWVSSLGGNYLFSPGSIPVDDATIDLLTRGVMPGSSDSSMTGALLKEIRLLRTDKNEDTDS